MNRSVFGFGCCMLLQIPFLFLRLHSNNLIKDFKEVNLEFSLINDEHRESQHCLIFPN